MLWASYCGTWGWGGRLRRRNGAPSDKGDGEGDELHQDDKGDAGGPFAESPEGSGNDSGCGSAKVVAGDIDTRGRDSGSGRRCDTKVALRSGLRDEDSAGEGGEPDDDDGEGMNEREKDSGDGTGDGAADPGAESNAGDEVSGEGRDHESDEVNEEERT